MCNQTGNAVPDYGNSATLGIDSNRLRTATEEKEMAEKKRWHEANQAGESGKIDIGPKTPYGHFVENAHRIEAIQRNLRMIEGRLIQLDNEKDSLHRGREVFVIELNTLKAINTGNI